MNWRVMRGPLILLLALLVALPSAPSGAEGALAEVELLGSSAFLSAGSIYVVGEVRNTGAAPVTLVRAVATFRDAGNAVIGSACSFALHDILGAGQVSPFLIERTEPAGYASYELALDWAPSISGPMPQLTFGPARHYVDSYGFHTWVGEVSNTTGFAVASPEIVLTLYDAEGAVRNVEHEALFHDVLAPGQKGPYQLVLFQGPTDYASLSFSSDCRLSTTAPPTLRSLGVKQSVGPGGGPRFTGQIQNIGSSRVSRVRAVVTLYDASGAVVNASYDWTDPISLDPGEAGPFDVTFPEAYQGWTTYRLDPPSQAPTATPTATRTMTATRTRTETPVTTASPTITPTATPTTIETLTPTVTATATMERWRGYLPLIVRHGER